MRVCAVWLALAGAALGAENVRLVYQREPGAESCPEAPALRRAVAARLGYDPFVEPAGRSLRAVIGWKGRWLYASIELTDENGELVGTNQLTPRVRNCDTLASAVALAIALAIDPLHTAAAPTRTPEPVVVVPPPSVPPPPVPVPVSVRRARPAPPEPEDDADTHLVGHLAILGAVAAEPQASWGMALGLAARWRRFSVGVEVRGDLPGSRVTLGGTVSSALVTTNFLPCARAYGFSFCGLLSVGVMIAWGADFAVDHRTSLPFVGGGARAAWELKLTRRLSMGLHADLLAPFTRALLRVDSEEVWHAEPVSGAFGVLVSGVLK
jgi:hypothetical protein